MRTYFTSEKRPSNLARRLRSSLDDLGTRRTMPACREAVAKGTGYRNWNEMLKVISFSQQAQPSLDHQSMERQFCEKIAAALDIPMSVALAAVHKIRPFEEPRVRELTDAHIRLLVANLCDAGYEIEDVSVSGYAGFKLSAPSRTSDADQSRREMASPGLCYTLHVSPDGRSVYDHENPETRRSVFGSDDFNHIMNLAKLTSLPITPLHRSIDGSKSKIVYETLRRLDKKVLLLMKCAGDFDCWSYMAAFTVLEESPIFELAIKYPALATQYTTYHRWNDFHRGEVDVKAIEAGKRVFAADPVEAFARYVDRRQKSLWPDIAVSMERVRAVTETYLSVPVNEAYTVTADAPAFMCHLPDAILPRKSDSMDELVHFVDRHLHVFEPDGMCVCPTSFATEFKERVNGDWSRARELSDIEYVSPHPEIGSIVLGVAGREAGYAVSAADFEDLQGEFADLRFTVGHLLAKDARLEFFKVADGMKRVEGARRPVHLVADATREDDFLEEGLQFALYREVGLIHPKHKHASAIEILASIGYDIEDIISSLEREPEGLPSPGTSSVPTY
jgi:hypothetical protein